MIEDSEKRDRQLTFELHNSHVCEKRSNPCTSPKYTLAISYKLLRMTVLVSKM